MIILRYVESKDGRNTLHDTVGICYQDIPTEGEQIEIIEYDTSVNPPAQQWKRRTFDFLESEIQNIDAKLFYKFSFVSPDDLSRIIVPSKMKNFERLNISWVISHFLGIADTPSYVGYHAKIRIDNSQIQKIDYLMQINNSPTDPAVVRETMLRSVELAEECGVDYVQVTYDLAIAKLALKLFCTFPDVFKKLFLHFGIFHVDIALFKSIGKFIDGSGISNIIIDSGILASGSIGTFISGKHYNRCKKIHVLMSLAVQILHFENFVDAYKKEYEIQEIQDIQDIEKYLKNFQNTKDENPTINNPKVKNFIKAYCDYKKDTLEGKHRNTAKFHLLYVTLVDYYLTLDYSVRTGDFEMYKYILQEINHVFFALTKIIMQSS